MINIHQAYLSWGKFLLNFPRLRIPMRERLPIIIDSEEVKS